MNISKPINDKLDFWRVLVNLNNKQLDYLDVRTNQILIGYFYLLHTQCQVQLADTLRNEYHARIYFR